MSLRNYILRAALYALLAVLPVAVSVTEQAVENQSWPNRFIIVAALANAAYQAALAIRAFIDKSPALYKSKEHE
jgi:hypothetical protein